MVIVKMYFRNKFNEEFLYLCNQQPKGGKLKLDDKNHIFWEVFQRKSYFRPGTLHVIPLLLFNTIKSSNPRDVNIEDFMMVCEDRGDTTIECLWDDNHVSEQALDFICDMGITNITGDLEKNSKG